MCKRVISVLLALMLVLTLFPVSALAEEPEETGNQIAGAAENPSQPDTQMGESEEPLSSVEGDVPAADPEKAGRDPSSLERNETPLVIVPAEEEISVSFPAGELSEEELLEGYFTKRVVAELYGDAYDSGFYQSSGTHALSGDLLKLYNLLKAQITAVAEGRRTNTQISITAEDLGLVSNPVAIDQAQATYNTVSQRFSGEDLKKVLNCLILDCGYELYWFDKTADTKIALNPNKITDNQNGTATINVGWTYSLTVSEDYRDNASNLYVAEKPAKVAAAATKAAAIVDKYASASDYEKLAGYKDEICALVDYNHAAAGDDSTPYGDPWQMIDVFDGDSTTKVVCEGYAKAFQYLCDLGGLDCYTVTGQMGGGTGAGAHMWNIVRLGGKSYLVDVTNSDTGSAGADGSLFMVGASPVSGSYAGGDLKYAFGLVTYEYDHLGADRTDQYAVQPESVLVLAEENCPKPKPAVELNITGPGTYTIPGYTSLDTAGTATYTLTAALKGGGSEPALPANGWTWSVAGAPAGVTVTGTGPSATLSVTSAAGAENITVKAVCDAINAAGETVLALTKESPVATFVKVNGETTIVKADDGTGTGRYTATVYDQYKTELTPQPAVTWTTDPSGNGISVNSDGIVTAANVAPNTAFTLKATTANSKEGTLRITVVDKPPHVIEGTLQNISLVVGEKRTQTVRCTTGGTVTYSITTEAGQAGVAAVNASTGEVTAMAVGSVEVTATAAGGDVYGPAKVRYTVTVTPKTLTAAMVADISAKPYTGDAQTPVVTVRDGAKTLVKDTDYTVSVSPASPTNAGSYTVTVTGKGNYTGPVDKTFRITPASLTTAPAVTNPAAVLASEGKNAGDLLTLAQTANAGLKVKGLKNEDVDLGAVWNLVSGTYDPKGGSYVYELTLTSANTNYTYTGTKPRVTVTVTPVNLTLSLSETSSTRKASQTEDTWVPAATVTATCSPTVTPAPIVRVPTWTATPTIAAAKAAVDSTGNSQTVTLKPTVEGVPQWATWDASKTPVYTLTLTAKDPAEITISGLADKVYDGAAAATPTFTVTGNAGAALDASKVTYKFYPKGSGTALAGAPKDAGEYTLRAAYTDDNYEGVKSLDFAITKRPAALTWENIAERTYDGQPSTVAAKVSNLAAGDTDETVKVTVTGGDAVKAGTHTATAAALTGGRSANYELPAAATQDYTINKASRTLTVAPATLTLLPGSAEGTITVTPSADLDSSFAASVEYALTGDVTAVTWNKTAGKVTGVGNGTVTISVSAKATENYEAAPAETVAVTAVMKPVTGVTVNSSDPADKFTAVLDGKTVKVSGIGDAANADVTLALDTAAVPGLTQRPGASNTIEVVYGGNVIETYTVDTSAVVEKPANVTLAEKPADTEIPAGFDSAAGTAVNSTAADGLMASASKALLEAAKGKQGEGVTDVKVETQIKVEAKEYVNEPTNKSLTVNITPQYIITVTKADGTVEASETKTIPNSAIRSAVTLTVELPVGFLTGAAGEKVFVEHTPSGGGRMEVIRAEVVSGTTVGWQQTSFSTDKIVVSTDSVQVTFNNGTTTQTVTYDYADAVNGTALPSSGTSGGWIYEGRNYTAMTKGLFDALLTAGGTATFDRPAADVPSGSSGGHIWPTYDDVVAKYPVTVSGGIRNGHVSVSPARAAEGTTVTVTVKPDQGYELDTLRVVDRDGNEVRVRGDGSEYTFSMPRSAVTVSAAFKEAAAPAAHSFRDVDSSHWAAEAITWAYENGYMNGNSATTFNPQGTITRQQLWMILARLSGADPANFAEARAWAVNNGVSDGSNPAANMSRQQMVTFLHRYAEMRGYRLTGSADLTAFPDHASVANYAVEPLSWSVANSIVSGTANGTLNPGGTATRAQFAVILQRFYGSVVEG